MGISFSLLLLAAGAILAFAVQDNVAELDLGAIGWVMMVVGIIGLLFSLLFWSSFAPFSETTGRAPWRRTAVYVDDAPMTRRTVIDEYDEVPPVRRRTTVDEHTQDPL